VLDGIAKIRGTGWSAPCHRQDLNIHLMEARENGGAKLGHGSGGIVLLRAV
jgi:hypothetical protein